MCRHAGAGGQSVARERNRRARKIQREAVAIDDDLGDVRVRALGVVVDPPPQRAHHRARRPLANGATASSIIVRLDQRLVSLHVDDRVARAVRPRPPRCDRCRSDAPARSSARRRRTPGRRDGCARRRSRRSPTRSTAPPRRADRRARSSAGRRCRRALCREPDDWYRAGMMAMAETKAGCTRKARSWKQGARQILPQLHSASDVANCGRTSDRVAHTTSVRRLRASNRQIR